MEDKIATLNTVLSIPKPFIIRVFSLTFYPGSELYTKYVNDYPEQAENYLEKNFCLPTHENYNEILKMMPFLFPWLNSLLMRMYFKNNDSRKLKYLAKGIKYFNVLFIKPFRHLKLVHRSFHGDTLKIIKSLHRYFLHYVSKHLPAFGFLRNKGVLPF